MRIKIEVEFEINDVKKVISKCGQEDYKELIDYMIETLDNYSNYLVTKNFNHNTNEDDKPKQ